MTAPTNPIRKEWIDAVFGTDFYATKDYVAPLSGAGRANIESYTCYTGNLRPNKRDKNKVGLSLTNIQLGLYVSNIRKHSEAEYAGVLSQSVLVSINQVGLLGEVSAHALESVWRVEHAYYAQCSKQSNGGNGINGLSKVSTCCSGSKNSVVEMVFISKGRLYTVHFFTNDFGIEWQSVGDFTVVRKAPKEGNVRKGSLLLSFGELNFRSSSSAQFAAGIVDASAELEVLDFTLGYTPASARFSISPSKSKNVGLANLACTTSSVHSGANKALIDSVSLEQNAKQLKLTALMAVDETNTAPYPRQSFLCKLVSESLTDSTLDEKLKGYKFSAENVDLKRCLRFNLAYHEVQYVEDRLSVSEHDEVSSSTKYHFSFELNDENNLGSSYILDLMRELEDSAKKLASVHKAKKSEKLRKCLEFKQTVPYPLNHSTRLTKLLIDDCHVLPSVHSPILLTFETNLGLSSAELEVTVDVLSFKAPPGTYKVYGVIRGTKLSLDASIAIKV